MNENEFELDGKVYVAVESNGCEECEFDGLGVACVNAPPCGVAAREDMRDVIFMEKPQ